MRLQLNQVILSLCVILFTFECRAQSEIPQGLEAKNGFKTIILGSDISTLNVKFLLNIDDKNKAKGDSIINYEYTDSTLWKISDDVKLQTIGVTTYKNKILSITLIYNRNVGENLWLLFTKAYGIPVQRNKFISNYEWYSDKVKLTMDFDNSNICYAMFTCNPLQAELDNVKRKSNEKAVRDL